jgi:hypothetical protein
MPFFRSFVVAMRVYAFSSRPGQRPSLTTGADPPKSTSPKPSVVTPTVPDMTRTEDAPVIGPAERTADRRDGGPDSATLAYWERMQQLRRELDALRPAN